jgi:hypothetical protein
MLTSTKALQRPRAYWRKLISALHLPVYDAKVHYQQVYES